MRYLAPLFFTLALAGCTKSNANTANAKPTPGTKPVPCPVQNSDHCRSFLLKLTGVNGRPPNANDLTAVAAHIGNLVSTLKTQNYFLLERFVDGGFRACLDPVSNGGYDAAVYEFNTFRVGHDTLWDIQPVISCTGSN